MDRRTFTKSCVMCLGGAVVVPVLTGCQATHYASGTIEPNGLSVAKSEFIYLKKNQPQTRSYIIVRHDKLEFPIYVYRISENDYSAVLMKCAHQGSELQASGDHLSCPAHGSEYNKLGVVTNGPAETNLRSFNVTSQSDKIFIDLRA